MVNELNVNLDFRGIFHADFPRIFNNQEMLQSNDRVHPWKQRFGKKFWWKTSTKSCKKSCKVMQFYWSERIRTPLFSWFLSSAKFWPNIRSDPAGFKFKRWQIPERQGSRKFLEIRFNFYEVQWNSVYLSCYGKRKKKKKKKTRYRGIRVSCLTLRDVVLIRC